MEEIHCQDFIMENLVLETWRRLGSKSMMVIRETKMKKITQGMETMWGDTILASWSQEFESLDARIARDRVCFKLPIGCMHQEGK